MIELSNVSYGWSEDNVLQSHLDLILEPGKVYVILGTNGCGKSSFFNLFSANKMFRSGTVHIDGLNLKAMRANDLARKIITIGQNRDSNYDMKVFDYLLTAYYPYTGLFSSPSKKAELETYEILKRHGLLNWTDRIVSTLSGGEFTCVQLARCHIGARDYIFMDETDRALDYANQILFMENVLKLRDEGKCVVIISHNPNLALYLNSYVLFLGKKCKYKFGHATEIVTRENLQTFYGIDVIDTYNEELNLHHFAPKINSLLLNNRGL